MTSLHLKQAPGGATWLVIRRHDLSGCDYEGVCAVPMEVARLIAERGVAIDETSAPSCGGRPGVVIRTRRPDAVTRVLEIRADAADPTTVVASAEIDALTASACLADRPIPVDWVVRPDA